MKKASKIVALALALIMAFGLCASAETESYYLTISDPYFTDGTTTYDLTGLSAKLQLSELDNGLQALLSLITVAGTLNGYAQIDEQGVTLYADGLSAAYTITFEEIIKRLGGMMPMPVQQIDINEQDMLLMMDSPDIDDIFDIDDIDINELLNAAYLSAKEEISLFTDRETVTIDTLMFESISAERMPYVIDAQTMDAMFTELAKQIDEEGIYAKFITYFMARNIPNFGSIITPDNIETALPATCLEAYQQYIAPMQINISGDVYESEASVFADVVLYTGNIALTSYACEFSGGDEPAFVTMYDFSEGDDETYFVIAVQGGAGTNVEFSILEGDVPVFNAQYSRAFNAEYGADLYEIYLGVVDGVDAVEMSAQYISDDATFRMMYAGISAEGMIFEINYNGAISKADKYTESAQLSLTSNIGFTGKINIAFGEADAPGATIPDDGSVAKINMASMTEEQAAQQAVDIEVLTSNLLIYLIYGVPGFATVLQALTTTMAQ